MESIIQQNIISYCYYGIEPSSNTTMMGNQLNNNQYGIYLSSVQYDNVIDNRIDSSQQYGIYVLFTGNHIFYNNTISNTLIGMELTGFTNQSQINSLSQNHFVNSSLYPGFDITSVESLQIDTTNTVNGNPIYFYKDQINLIPSNFGSNAGQIILVNCNNSAIANVNITSLGAYAIFSIKSSFNSFSNISVSQANYGLYLRFSYNNTIQNSLFYNCTQDGIFAQDSSNNTYFNNKFSFNQNDGLYINYYCNNSLFYYNTFINNYNHQNAYDYYNNANNRWDNGSVGNYWDDYAGIDNNGDGIGDSPYSVPGGDSTSIDHFPLWVNAPQVIITAPSNNSIANQTAPTLQIRIDSAIGQEIWYSIPLIAYSSSHIILTHILHENVSLAIDQSK
jgi:parallel beta-helix repeat protein